MVVKNAEKPWSFISGTAEKTSFAFSLRPAAEKKSFETSMPTKRLYMQATPMLFFGAEAGEASRPNLQSNKGSYAHPTTLGFGEAGNRLQTGFGDPGEIEFSCLSASLNCTI